MMYLCMCKSPLQSSLPISPLSHTDRVLTYKHSDICDDITPVLPAFLNSHSTHNTAIFLKPFNEFYMSDQLCDPAVTVFCRLLYFLDSLLSQIDLLMSLSYCVLKAQIEADISPVSDCSHILPVVGRSSGDTAGCFCKAIKSQNVFASY